MPQPFVPIVPIAMHEVLPSAVTTQSRWKKQRKRSASQRRKLVAKQEKEAIEQAARDISALSSGEASSSPIFNLGINSTSEQSASPSDASDTTGSDQSLEDLQKQEAPSSRSSPAAAKAP